ncbi:solute carrier family 35 member G1 [Stegostoma tigrinum]|uniref:solute carrier family 35 member G1 n=1 Tax=Stegostoma tigrinum TaxID=3053191 RepID=UPI00202B92DF|nr:solute carrier family 35 member G1 [Stegostoma tigrinum]
MSVYYKSDEEEDVAAVVAESEPHVLEVEKPGREAANVECNGTSGTGRRAAIRKHSPLTSCCHSGTVRDSADEGGTPATEKKPKCVGLGLCYTLLSCLFFSVTSFLVKKVDGIHALEISGIRCLFQWLFTWPAIIYNEIDLLGPKGLRVLLCTRGILGAVAMMLLFYAIQQMPLADATVIMFSNPVFVSVFACIFLKERCTFWDPIFTVFTLTGVVLIARPPFLFGSRVSGSESDYKNRMKGTAAAFGSAICAALTLTVIRKMGKSVSYLLSIWYYSVVGLILSVIMVSALQEWSLPFCGTDRVFLLLIGICGLGGQIFLTKALQIEKAASVALMKTTEVMLAFIFQYLFLNYTPSWWSLGGALCVTLGTSGVAFQKWYNTAHTRKITNSAN